jgi:hypothetical protein
MNASNIILDHNVLENLEVADLKALPDEVLFDIYEYYAQIFYFRWIFRTIRKIIFPLKPHMIPYVTKKMNESTHMYIDLDGDVIYYFFFFNKKINSCQSRFLRGMSTVVL